MKAAVNTEYGSPDVVRLKDVERPSVGAEDVLVKVHATTVNRTDCAYRTATPFVARPLFGLVRPRVNILGNEFAGVVEQTGPSVTSFRVGDRVFGYIEGPYGAHAEYLRVPQTASIATIPDGVSFETAAASSEGAHYALMLIGAGRIQRGHDVLVYGATGAIGSAAVQLLKSVGATVTAVCDTANVELVRSLGADKVIDYTSEDFTADSQRYDVVLDAVGKSTFAACRRLLNPSGVYISTDVGSFWQNPLLALITSPLSGRRVRFPIPKHDQDMIGYFARLLDSGEFTPVIDRRYSLDEIVAAHRHVDTEQKIGNVVVDMPVRSLCEDADPAGSDQEPDDDEQNAEQQRTAEERNNPADHEDYGDDPQNEFHS